MQTGGRPRIATVVAAMAVATVVGLGAGYLWIQSDQPAVRSTGTAAIGGRFQLTDHMGVRRSDADFRGRNMLLFFGYTNCPDFCPTGLQSMAEALDLLGSDADRIVPIFVTVDPERDTSEVLKAYVGLFHPRLIGLSGSAEEVAAAARVYRVYYAKVPDEEGGDDYLMDHSTFTYLMGPDGRYLTHFRHGTPPAEVAARIRKLL
ncbi:MAG: SCO family protein [Alphaproteobacteria bacterium]|nr:SCO family protein [Alphaproteobacteria bacterium]